MMLLLSRLATIAGLVLLTASPLYAVSLRDLIRLSQAGLGDAVLVALIELDSGPFALTADQILELRQAGVSEPVIVALIRAAGTPSAPIDVPIPAEAPLATYAPTVPDTQYVVEQVPVAVPVYVPVFVAPTIGLPHGSHSRSGVATDVPLGGRRFINIGGGQRAQPALTPWEIGQVKGFHGSNTSPRSSSDGGDGQKSRRERNTRRPR